MKTSSIPELFLMCGLPRCGKTSWINANKKDKIIVSPDAIRKEIFGHQFHAPANKFVFAISEAMTSLLLKQGKSVIVDATHLTKAIRMGWYPVFKDSGAKVTIVWVYAHENASKNLEICKMRSRLSPSDEIVPDSALDRMAAIFEDPDPINDDWANIIKYRNPTK